MTREATEIEVEVVEIENSAPGGGGELAPGPPVGGDDGRDWRRWQGGVRRFDSRWSPLWVIPGIIALFLLATVGLVIGLLVGLLVAVFLFCRWLLRALFR